MTKFKVGDRIKRGERVGTITRVYKSTPNYLGEAIPLYGVQWDGYTGSIQGYMDNGFELVEEEK